MKLLVRLSIILLLSSCKSTIVVPQWSIFEKEVISKNDYPDPFRDVDLHVTVTRPDGTSFDHFGFYDGGKMWRFRIMTDMEGTWKYRAVFSDNSSTISGKFSCTKSDLTGPLEPYSENPIWPAFRGSKPVQIRSFHTGDRFFASNFSDEERKRFLDFIHSYGYNMISVASHYLNRRQEGRGLGWETPRLWPLDPEEYRRMESILTDLERRNIYVHPFAGFFGRASEFPVDHAEQELYIKYTLARIASFRNILLNVGGPEPLLKPEEYQDGSMTREDIIRVAGLIKKYDPYNHMLSVHNRTGNGMGDYERDPFITESWEDYATLQGAKSTDFQAVYKFITDSRKVVKPMFAHEVMWYRNMYHEGLNPETLSMKALTLIMSGAFINFGDMNGNSSSGFSGSLNPDSANIEAHKILKSIWDTFDKLPLHVLAPADSLVENAFCLSDGSSSHLFYSPSGESFSVGINLPAKGKWINPLNGTVNDAVISTQTMIPPDNSDWLLYVE